MFKSAKKANEKAINEAIEGMEGVRNRVNEVYQELTFPGIEEPDLIKFDYIDPKGYAVLRFASLGLTRYSDDEVYPEYLQAVKRAADLPGPHIVLPIY